MDVFATEFASRYTRAWRQEIPRPRCWQASWDVADDGNLLIVQHLLLGINAHVNYDLPQAAAAAARETGDLASVRKDFDAVNDVLAEVSVGVLDDLDRLSQWTSMVAALGGGRAFNFSLRAARAQAWGAAERLYALDEHQQRGIPRGARRARLGARLSDHPAADPGRGVRIRRAASSSSATRNGSSRGCSARRDARGAGGSGSAERAVRGRSSAGPVRRRTPDRVVRRTGGRARRGVAGTARGRRRLRRPSASSTWWLRGM